MEPGNSSQPYSAYKHSQQQHYPAQQQQQAQQLEQQQHPSGQQQQQPAAPNGVAAQFAAFQLPHGVDRQTVLKAPIKFWTGQKGQVTGAVQREKGIPFGHVLQLADQRGFTSGRVVFENGAMLYYSSTDAPSFS